MDIKVVLHGVLLTLGWIGGLNSQHNVCMNCTQNTSPEICAHTGETVTIDCQEEGAENVFLQLNGTTSGREGITSDGGKRWSITMGPEYNATYIRCWFILRFDPLDECYSLQTIVFIIEEHHVTETITPTLASTGAITITSVIANSSTIEHHVTETITPTLASTGAITITSVIANSSTIETDAVTTKAPDNTRAIAAVISVLLVLVMVAVAVAVVIVYFAKKSPGCLTKSNGHSRPREHVDLEVQGQPEQSKPPQPLKKMEEEHEGQSDSGRGTQTTTPSAVTDASLAAKSESTPQPFPESQPEQACEGGDDLVNNNEEVPDPETRKEQSIIKEETFNMYTGRGYNEAVRTTLNLQGPQPVHSAQHIQEHDDSMRVDSDICMDVNTSGTPLMFLGSGGGI